MLADKVLEIVQSGSGWTLESLARDTRGSPSTIRGILSCNGYGKGAYRGVAKRRTTKVSVSLSPETVTKLKALAARESRKTTLGVLVNLAVSRYLETGV